MHPLNPWRTGGALAFTAAVLYGVCTFAVAVWPAGMLALFGVWTHGLERKPLLPTAMALSSLSVIVNSALLKRNTLAGA